MKLCFGYKQYNNMLLETGLPNFDTVNCRRTVFLRGAGACAIAI